MKRGPNRVEIKVVSQGGAVKAGFKIIPDLPRILSYASLVLSRWPYCLLPPQNDPYKNNILPLMQHKALLAGEELGLSPFYSVKQLQPRMLGIPTSEKRNSLITSIATHRLE